jgi:hypothetical protein
MKIQADHNRTERSFQVGEHVLLKLQPYTQSSVVNRPFPKLVFKYFGPYKVVEKLGEVTYKLELLADSLVHLVFHVSQLKEFTPDHSRVFSQLPDIPLLDIAEITSAKILDRRLVKKSNNAVTQILVQWTSLPESSTCVFRVWFLKMVSRNRNSLFGPDSLFLRNENWFLETGPFGVLDPNKY